MSTLLGERDDATTSEDVLCGLCEYQKRSAQVYALNGLTTGTTNWQTFSHLAFAFRITPDLLLAGITFGLTMGVLGGPPPAIPAAWRPVVVALREL